MKNIPETESIFSFRETLYKVVKVSQTFNKWIYKNFLLFSSYQYKNK